MVPAALRGRRFYAHAGRHGQRRAAGAVCGERRAAAHEPVQRDPPARAGNAAGYLCAPDRPPRAAGGRLLHGQPPRAHGPGQHAAGRRHRSPRRCAARAHRQLPPPVQPALADRALRAGRPAADRRRAGLDRRRGACLPDTAGGRNPPLGRQPGARARRGVPHGAGTAPRLVAQRRGPCAVRFAAARRFGLCFGRAGAMHRAVRPQRGRHPEPDAAPCRRAGKLAAGRGLAGAARFARGGRAVRRKHRPRAQCRGQRTGAGRPGAAAAGRGGHTRGGDRRFGRRQPGGAGRRAVCAGMRRRSHRPAAGGFGCVFRRAGGPGGPLPGGAAGLAACRGRRRGRVRPPAGRRAGGRAPVVQCGRRLWQRLCGRRGRQPGRRRRGAGRGAQQRPGAGARGLRRRGLAAGGAVFRRRGRVFGRGHAAGLPQYGRPGAGKPAAGRFHRWSGRLFERRHGKLRDRRAGRGIRRPVCRRAGRGGVRRYGRRQPQRGRRLRAGPDRRRGWLHRSRRRARKLRRHRQRDRAGRVCGRPGGPQ